MGPYRLGQELGRGAMGVVYAAVHERLGFRVALKTLLGDSDATAERALRRELKLIARLDHPHVVAVYDQGVLDGRPWMAMERATHTLQQCPPRRIRPVLRQVLLGLAAAHARGILHLDLKPSNLLVRRDGDVLLADFGIARTQGDLRKGVWGSPGFMAPETFDRRQERLGRSTDLFSVGCIAWTFCMGAPPSDDGRFDPMVPAPMGFHGWLTRLLEPDSTRRFQSACAALEALDRLSDGLIEARAPVALMPTMTVQNEWVAPVPSSPVDQDEATWERPAIPARWPSSVPRRPRRGTGVLGWLEVPWIERPNAQRVLWNHFRLNHEGGHCVVFGGPRTGKSRLVSEFLQAAHRHAGREVLLVTESLQSSMRRAWGSSALGWADRFAVDREVASAWVSRLEDEPGCVLRELTAQTPVVVAFDGVATPPLPDAFVVSTASTEGDVALLSFTADETRSCLAAWVNLDPEAVADLVQLTGGDLAACVALVEAGAESGSFAELERGWAPVVPLPERLPNAWLDAWDPFVEPVDLARPNLRRVAVLDHPGASATPDELAAVEHLEELGLLNHGEWCSPLARRNLAARLGDLSEAHREVAERFEHWNRGEHLYEAGERVAGRTLLLASVWWKAARGEMARVAMWVRRLERELDLPVDDPVHGELLLAKCRLGPTHQGYTSWDGFAQRGMELSVRFAGRPGWDELGGQFVAHQMFKADVQLDPRSADDLEATLIERVGRGPYTAQLLAWVDLRRGDVWSVERRVVEAASELDDDTDGGHKRIMLDTLLWIARGVQGHPEAVEQYDRVGQSFLDAGFQSAAMDVAFVRGEQRRWAGRPEEALVLYERALAIAASGEARADVGPYLGMALANWALGQFVRSREWLTAARQQLGDAGPSWHALVDIHDAVAGLALGERVDVVRVEQATRVFQRTGFVDNDLRRALTHLGAALESPDLAAAAVRMDDIVAGFQLSGSPG